MRFEASSALSQPVPRTHKALKPLSGLDYSEPCRPKTPRLSALYVAMRVRRRRSVQFVAFRCTARLVGRLRHAHRDHFARVVDRLRGLKSSKICPQVTNRETLETRGAQEDMQVTPGSAPWVPRFLRLQKAALYLGMNKNSFNSL